MSDRYVSPLIDSSFYQSDVIEDSEELKKRKQEEANSFSSLTGTAFNQAKQTIYEAADAVELSFHESRRLLSKIHVVYGSFHMDPDRARTQFCGFCLI